MSFFEMMCPVESRAERALRNRAFALAESGRYGAGREVRRALIGEGWPLVGRLFDRGAVGRAVEEKCRAAQGATPVRPAIG